MRSGYGTFGYLDVAIVEGEDGETLGNVVIWRGRRQILHDAGTCVNAVLAIS